MRDAVARRIVAWGLRIATPDGRLRIMHTIADHWRTAVRTKLRGREMSTGGAFIRAYDTPELRGER